jgi:iron complex outermembrane receptor protein
MWQFLSDSRTTTVRTFCGLAALLISGPVLAQGVSPAQGDSAASNPPPESDATEGTFALEEVVVTAQKRAAADIQSIPASLVALGGEELQARGINDLKSFTELIPAVAFQEYAGNTFILIRGIGTSVAAGNIESSVAVHVDGVYLPRPTMGKIRAYDLERIELLRGPQGTLYGRNSTAGAVNLISAKPTKELQAGFEARLGNYDSSQFNAFVSGPISEKLSFRMSGAKENRDGYVRNLFTGVPSYGLDFYSARGALRFEPSDDLTIDLSVMYQKNTNDDSEQQRLGPPMPAGFFPSGTIYSTEPWTVSSELAPSGFNRTTIYAANVDWRLNDRFSVRSITGAVDHATEYTHDNDGTNRPTSNIVNYARESRTFQQEIDLVGETEWMNFVLGAFYFDENFSEFFPTSFPLGAGAAFPPGSFFIRGHDQDIRSYAFFGDGSINVTDRFRINVGIRYNSERNRFLQTSGTAPSGLTLPLIPGTNFNGVVDRPFRISLNKFLPKIGVEFDVAPRILAYAQYQQGLKSGGPSLGQIDRPFGEEVVDAYELGLKSSFLDGRATLNTSGYHYKYKGLQTPLIPPGAISGILGNADAGVDGFEVELSILPVENLLLNIGGAIIKAKYKDVFLADGFQPQLGQQNLRGNRLERVPESSLNASFLWTVPVHKGPLGEIQTRGDALYTGDTYYRAFNVEPYDLQEGYTIFNASVAFVSEDDRYRLRFYIDNAGDKAHKQVVAFAGLIGGFITNYASPRMYGVSLSARF